MDVEITLEDHQDCQKAKYFKTQESPVTMRRRTLIHEEGDLHRMKIDRPNNDIFKFEVLLCRACVRACARARVCV